MVSVFLGAFVVALFASLIGCAVALNLFPWFRSGERKAGHFRVDQSTGNFQVDLRRNGVKVQRVRPGSAELPLVGGPAMIIAVVVVGLVAGFVLNFGTDQWKLLGILLVSALGFGAVGFVDDWRKVHRGVGISEITKFAGVAIVSLGAAVALNRLIVVGRLSARFAYPPYSDIPVLGAILQHTHFAWIAFFLLMTVTVATTTPLAVDFADGMDGLCGGLMVSAALAFAVVLLDGNRMDQWPLALVSLVIAGAAVGYLPFNWPSSWRGRTSATKRRARVIMGDSGSLALGGLLALVAVMSRLEFLLLIIGGIFVLEGLSALISARILVKFFRRFLYLERYRSGRGFPHTELPLPFLATPMHHHFDLLGWDRRRLVFGAWLLGAGLGVLGVASVMTPFSWERYLARLVGLGVLVAVWQTGPWTRYFFIGLAHTRGAANAPRRLGLFYGFPFKLFGRRLFACVDMTDISEEEITGPIEDLSLWQRMNVFDARSLLGYYCYRADAYEDALRIWDRIPAPNLKVRPEIEEKLAEVRHRVALEAEGMEDVLPSSPSIQERQGTPTTLAASADDPSASQWRLTAPTGRLTQPPRLEPGQHDPSQTYPPVTQLWTASSWRSALSATQTQPEPTEAPAADAATAAPPPAHDSTGHPPAQAEAADHTADEPTSGRSESIQIP